MGGSGSDDLSDAELALVTGGAGIGGTSGVNAVNIQGMDLETALMAVQGERAKLLEVQLKDQVQAVQDRNKSISLLNDVLGASRNLQATFKGDAKPDAGVPTGKELTALDEALKAAGVTIAHGNKGELDKAVENVKSMIDNQSNSQQMDMLRLQSLSNKRNEAFDVMTNFVKKMQESRSSIIGNMR